MAKISPIVFLWIKFYKNRPIRSYFSCLAIPYIYFPGNRFFIFLCLLAFACKTPDPDLSRQKLLQIAVLLSYDHPSAYRNVSQGLNQASAELSQVNIVLFGPRPQPQLTRRQKRQQKQQQRKTKEIKPDLENSYRAHVAWKKQQIQEIIERNFDILIFFGDELVDLNKNLKEARAAGLILVYCGFSSKPLISQAYPQLPIIPTDIYLDGEGLPRQNNNNSLLPYINAKGQIDVPSQPFLPLQDYREHNTDSALVHINISPSSLKSLAYNLTNFLRTENNPNHFSNINNENIQQNEKQPHPQTRANSKAILLFGPSESPFTRSVYHQMREGIIASRKHIQAVRFLNPWNIKSSDQIRNLITELPKGGRILAFDPLLLYSSVQMVQRYGSPDIKIAGLGWEELYRPLNGPVQLLIPLRYEALAYAAVHASFMLYSGQKKGQIGEYFSLGRYGQRQLDRQGSLILNNFYLITDSTQSTPGFTPGQPKLKEYKRPSRVPKNPNRGTILSEYDLRN